MSLETRGHCVTPRMTAGRRTPYSRDEHDARRRPRRRPRPGDHRDDAPGGRRRHLGQRDAERAPLRGAGLSRTVANPEWEIGDSRISKLWIQRLADKREVFNWDRGPDRTAADDTTLQIVAFLAGGLADHVYAE
jgi:hypothetical protein